ncbi:MAG: hypothetical protein Q8K55_14635 [Gemmatimonadaceae bacterium]|nr:hypothetical protein [Gemmatimonadaceae bacterium]
MAGRVRVSLEIASIGNGAARSRRLRFRIFRDFLRAFRFCFVAARTARAIAVRVCAPAAGRFVGFDALGPLVPGAGASACDVRSFDGVDVIIAPLVDGDQ